jgi:predicted RND superfamily exporter protein
MEEQVGIQSQISPALTIVLLLVLSIALGIYVQEHLNRVWDKASGHQAPVAPPTPPPPSAIAPG